METIKELHYNYKQACSDGKNVYCEDWNTSKVGDKGVLNIIEHLPYGEGDRIYYDIIYSDKKERIFNPCKVIYHTEQKSISQQLKDIWTPPFKIKDYVNTKVLLRYCRKRKR
jgi:hypothetical protein